MSHVSYTAAKLHVGDRAYDLDDVAFHEGPAPTTVAPVPKTYNVSMVWEWQPRTRKQKRVWRRFVRGLAKAFRDEGDWCHDAGPARAPDWQRGRSAAARRRFQWDEVKRARRWSVVNRGDHLTTEERAEIRRQLGWTL